MIHGGDKAIIRALKPFEITQVPLAVSCAAEDQRMVGKGETSWIDPAYPKMLRDLTAVMRSMGYGKNSEVVADAYMNGYVRGLNRGAIAGFRKAKGGKS
jgi:hypothetical protein